MNPRTKTLFCLLIFILFFANSYSQDTLFKKDSTQLAVKVLQVSSKEIKYYVLGKANPLIHFVKTKTLIAIKYENGECDSFPLIDEPSQPLFKNMLPADTIFHGHFVSVNFPWFYVSHFTLNYEYKLKSGHFGFKVPVSIGYRLLRKNNDVFGFSTHYEPPLNFYYYRYKLISTELQLLYYPFARGNVLGFFGPSAEIGKYDYFDFSTQPSSSYLLEYEKRQANYYCALLRVGLFIYSKSNIFITFNGAFGKGYSIQKFSSITNGPTHDYKIVGTQIRLAVSIGYHFNN